MIVNHKYKFIFFKSGKTGGSSMEIALSKFTSDNDIVTKLIEEEEEALRNNLGKNNKNAGDLRVHSTAADLLKFLEAPQYKDKDIFNSYFKFTIIREPIDLWLSHYFYIHNRKRLKRRGKSNQLHYGSNDINKWIDNIKHKRLGDWKHISEGNWNVYSLNNKLIVDDYITYSKDSGPGSKMYEDCTRISEKLNFPENLADIFFNTRVKTEYRKKDKVTLTKDSLDFIEEVSRREREITGMKLARKEYEKLVLPLL